MTYAQITASQNSRACPSLELNFEERVRSENWDNVADFSDKTDDAHHQWRYRTRLWASWCLSTKTMVELGLTNESRRITHPVTDFYPDETIFETFNVSHSFNDQVWVKAGRQNITKGDGFILFDGGPLDGSRTQYFNAINIGYVEPQALANRHFNLYLISDPYRDRYLPRFDDKKKPLIEMDERALALYYSDTRDANSTLDAYYVFKTQTGDTRARSSVPRLPDRAFHTIGGRVARQWERGWSLAAEAAGQAGVQQPSADVLAWGAAAAVKKAFARAPTKPSLQIGWTVLSGDDPSTTAYEGWDPLFSRYPKWSDLMVYTLAVERGAAYWTNLSMGQVEVQAAPVSRLKLRASYFSMNSFHAHPGKTTIFGTGAHRGDLFQARADLTLSGNWRGHVQGEYLKPGHFYVGRDAGWFFRVEAIYSFKKGFLT
jgi:hypothetical protein